MGISVHRPHGPLAPTTRETTGTGSAKSFSAGHASPSRPSTDSFASGTGQSHPVATSTPPGAPAPANYANLVVQQQIQNASRTLADWKSDVPTMKQTTANNCGATVGAMLVRAMGGGQGLTDAQLIDKVGQGFVDKNGVQPSDMNAMLGRAGLKVTRADAPQSAQALQTELMESLQWGKKTAALLDANTLEKNGQKGVSPHWVVIDGTDAKGNFVVKDPALGKALSVSADQLQHSLNACAKATGTSGFIGIEPRVQFGHDTGPGTLDIPRGLTHEVGDHGGGESAGVKSKTAQISA